MGLLWVTQLLRLLAASGGIAYTAMMVAVNSTEKSRLVADGEDFFYFGYGSNLLRERLQIMNPSAVLVSVGCLKGYKLAFGLFKGQESRWGGGVATVIPSPEDDVWGIVWRLKAADRQSLDDQESVKDGIYNPIEVKVEQEDAREVICLTYQMNYFNYSLPSPLYKKVMCTGAKQNGLPAEYIKKLSAIRTNNYNEITPFTMKIGDILRQLQNNTSE